MSSSPIIRSGDLRAENRYRILSSLRRQGAMSRAALGECTSLSQAAISTLIAQLSSEGVLSGDKTFAPASNASVLAEQPADAAPPSKPNGSSEKNLSPAPEPRARRGRPQTLVALEPQADCALIVSLAIDRLRVALIDYCGQELQVRDETLKTRSLDERDLLDRVGNTIDELIPLAPNRRISHIGVAFQGTTENDSGDLLWSPIIDVRSVPLGRTLTERFGVPVNVNNDCALIARALRHRQIDALGESFATVLFSHGVGLALTLKGESFTGIQSSALELGHLPFERGGALCRCGRRGCIEAYSADYGVVRLVGTGTLDESPPGRIDRAAMQALIAEGSRGETAPVQALAIAGAAIGSGLSTLFTLLDPMPVALVGRSDEALALMRDALQGAIRSGGHSDNETSLIGFSDEEPLINAGTALDSLDAVDRIVAARTVSPSNDALNRSSAALKRSSQHP